MTHTSIVISHRAGRALAAAVVVAALAACAPANSTTTSASATAGRSAAADSGAADSGAAGSGAAGGPATGSAASPACSKSRLTLHTAGKLTIGTDNPVYEPWFVHDTPANGKGFESAVAYAVAKQLGFADTEVTWTTVSFNSAIGPGPKTFDLDINEVSITGERKKAVDFSTGYFRRHSGPADGQGASGADKSLKNPALVGQFENGTGAAEQFGLVLDLHSPLTPA
jgi:polar amino acid transport system substrate-binding protein